MPAVQAGIEHQLQGKPNDNREGGRMTDNKRDTGAQVIQTAHKLTKAHRAVIGTLGQDRELARAERRQAERELFQACDADARRQP